MPNIPLSKHREDIKAFSSLQESYKLYAKVLKEVLEKARDIYAPLGFVESRAKRIESFSEKIIRKDKYKNPLIEMTDLCGARIIAHFSKQVSELCMFMEENFEIDLENSLDLKSRLRSSEFGYRSVHYIVIPRKPQILGIEIPEEIRNLKAEIQVRTFHQHIWADILHDRLYKSSLNVTDEWKRESARLAALLEEADNAFAGISETIDQLAVNYQASPEPEKLTNEIEILKVLVQINSNIDNKAAGYRLQLARIYNLTGNWEFLIELLEPVMNAKDINEFVYAGVLRELGYAECVTHLDTKDSPKYIGGISNINSAIAIFEKNPSKHKELALSFKYLTDVQELNALDYLAKAHKLSPGNPYYFMRLLIEKFSKKQNPDDFDIDLITSILSEKLSVFRQHIESGIEVAEANMNIGKILFLQSDFQHSMETYVNLMKMVLKDQLAFSKESLYRELINFDKIAAINPFNAHIIKGILHLMLWKKYKDKSSKEFLGLFRSNELFQTGEILVICGKSGILTENNEKVFNEYISEALRDFNGTVISGGTSTGIPGLVGTISASRRKNFSKNFISLGYLPEGQTPDHDYDRHVITKSSDFSALEILSYWVDILFSGIPAENVLVMGLNGGNISSLEYRIALALGARVCLTDKSGGAAHDVLVDKEWNKLHNLYNIPNEPYIMWAIINQDKPGILNREEIGILAPAVHEFYREKRRKELNPEKDTDINKFRVSMKWDLQSPSLKNSNLQQVAFMEHIFNRCGLKFHKSDKPDKYIISDDKVLDNMARMEHARWNAERLLDGWRFGSKDVLNKLTPYLIAWDEVDHKTKTYYYDPIKKFPELLMTIGYEVVEKK